MRPALAHQTWRLLGQKPAGVAKSPDVSRPPAALCHKWSLSLSRATCTADPYLTGAINAPGICFRLSCPIQGCQVLVADKMDKLC